MTEYQEGDEFEVEQEIDLYIDGDLKQVYVEYIEIESLDDDGNAKMAHYGRNGEFITNASITVDDIEEAEGDWMTPK